MVPDVEKDHGAGIFWGSGCPIYLDCLTPEDRFTVVLLNVMYHSGKELHHCENLESHRINTVFCKECPILNEALNLHDSTYSLLTRCISTHSLLTRCTSTHSLLTRCILFQLKAARKVHSGCKFPDLHGSCPNGGCFSDIHAAK